MKKIDQKKFLELYFYRKKMVIFLMKKTYFKKYPEFDLDIFKKFNSNFYNKEECMTLSFILL